MGNKNSGKKEYSLRICHIEGNLNNDKSTNFSSVSTYNGENNMKGKDQELIQKTFYWKEGGQKVFLVGSFSDWKMRHEMVLSERTGEHVIHMVNFTLNYILIDISLFQKECTTLGLSLTVKTNFRRII